MSSHPNKPELLTRDHPTVAYTWIGGISLVLVGAILLLHNSGMLAALPENW